MNEQDLQQSPATAEEIYHVAHRLYSQNPDWITFFHEVLGLQGIVRQAYPRVEQYKAFERTQEFQHIQDMVTRLQATSRSKTEKEQENTVITVRLPKTLHESLRAEAHDLDMSMNKLCISKLLKPFELPENQEADAE